MAVPEGMIEIEMLLTASVVGCSTCMVVTVSVLLDVPLIGFGSVVKATSVDAASV